MHQYIAIAITFEADVFNEIGRVALAGRTAPRKSDGVSFLGKKMSKAHVIACGKYLPCRVRHNKQNKILAPYSSKNTEYGNPSGPVPESSNLSSNAQKRENVARFMGGLGISMCGLVL